MHSSEESLSSAEVIIMHLISLLLRSLDALIDKQALMPSPKFILFGDWSGNADYDQDHQYFICIQIQHYIG